MVVVLSRTFTLGRYTCVERLGSSPVGEVWRAKRFGLAGLDRQYLVYRISATALAQDPTANLRLQAALRSVSEIQHQNLLRLEEFGNQAGDQFVAYEFVGFADLGKLKAGIELLGDEAKSLLPQIVALIGKQLARALAAAQERGVMHGLLSPSCVWIDQSGEALLAELGLWSVLPQGPWKLDGALKPLASFLAPELIESGVPGPRSEVFALGSVLSELLRLAPSDKLTPESKAAQPVLQALCQKATEKSTGQRLSNMLEVVSRLDAIRVTEAAQLQLQRFGQLFELAGDTVPQPVTTSDRSSAEPLPPPPSMRIAVGKSGDPSSSATAIKTPPAANQAASKTAADSKKSIPTSKPATVVAADKSSADANPTASPVSINPRAAFGAGMAGSATSAVTPTADLDAAAAEAANGSNDISNKIFATAKKRPSGTALPEADTISVTDTNPAMAPLPKATARTTPRRTATPSKAVGDEPTDQFKLDAAAAQLRAEEANLSAAVSDPSTLDAAEVMEENPALDSTGNYSQPELPPVDLSARASSEASTASASHPTASAEPSPPPLNEQKRLGTPAFIGIGIGAALIAGVVMFAVIGHGPGGGATVSDGGSVDGMSVGKEPAVAKTPNDEIQVDSTPAAAVYLDGEAKGKSPITLKVKPGPHKLLLVADAYKFFRQEASGGQSIAAKLVKAALPDDVTGPAAVKVKCKRDGELRILVDGNDSGLSCPTNELMLKPGKYTLGFLSPTSDELREKPLKVKKKGTKLKVKF